MPKEKNCDCCGKPFERGSTLFLIGNSLGRAPHVAGRAQRVYICEACECSPKPLFVSVAVHAFAEILESIGQEIREARSRTALAASHGVKNESSAAV